MKLLSKKERDREAQEPNPKCPCGKTAMGAWGFEIGDTRTYTPKMNYCREHLGDMIMGLEMILRDLKKVFMTLPG